MTIGHTILLHSVIFKSTDRTVAKLIRDSIGCTKIGTPDLGRKYEYKISVLAKRCMILLSER